MSREDIIEIVKSSFIHMIFDENIKVGHIDVLLHFPSMGIAIVEADEEKINILDDVNIEDIDSLLIRKELGSAVVYLDVNEKNFNVGRLINDILLEASFAPSENFLETRGTN